MKDQSSGQRLFGCILTVPLGCLAFCVGAVAVAFLMMPVACGRLLTDTLEDEFDTAFHGTLDIDDARLPSFHGEQRLALTLLDPGGTLVLRGGVRGPRIPVLTEPQVWGPLEIRLDEVHVRVDDEGVTSFERALARRSEAPLAFQLDLEGDSLEKLLAIDVVFSIERLTWTDARAEERRLELTGISGLGRLDLRPEHRLELSGSAAEPPVGFELVVAGRPGWPAHEGPEALEELGLRFELAAEELASSAADLLLHTAGDLEERVGPRLRSFVLRLDRRPGEPVAVTVKTGSGPDEKRLRVTGPRAAPELEPLAD